MSRRAIVAAAVLATATAGAVWLLASAAEPALGGSLSRAADGLLVARRYLEERGATVSLADRPFAESLVPEAGVVVVAFPWQVGGPLDAAQLAPFVSAGGTVLLAYTATEPGFDERFALAELGWTSDELRDPAPLGYRGWRRWMEEEWRLAPEGGAGPELTLRAPHAAPRPPAGAEIWYADPSGERGVIFASRMGRGRVVAVPRQLLGNAGLGRGANADLLELLLRRLGERWTFDEYHQGLVAAAAAPALVPTGVFEGILVHLALLYLLAVATLGRRFGPAWRPEIVRSGSVAGFLRGLGALHDRHGHHATAGRLLVERVRELEPHRRLPTRPSAPADGAGLVRLARIIAAHRGWRKPG